MFKFLNRINAGIQEQRLLLEQKKKISPSLKSRVDQYFDPGQLDNWTNQLDNWTTGQLLLV
jgi:hypothetical protein